MNVLDIKFKVMLNNSKCKIDSIDKINRLTTVILNDAKRDGAERFRFWYKKLKRLHPLIDAYMSGQINSSAISDVTAEHIVNTQADTQSVDLKYYFETVSTSSGTQENNIAPLPLRPSIRNKLTVDQLRMTENSYFTLNQNFGTIMSTFFESEDKSTWTINRIAAHSQYNTPDYNGFSVKVLLYDSQMETVYSKYKEKINLLDSIIPVQESVVIDYDPFYLTIEGKSIFVDAFGNKIIKRPTEIDNSVLNAVPLT